MFPGDRVSAWEDEKVLETDGGVGCTTVWMCLMPPSCALKMVKVLHFMLGVFCYDKKQGRENNHIKTTHTHTHTGV